MMPTPSKIEKFASSAPRGWLNAVGDSADVTDRAWLERHLAERDVGRVARGTATTGRGAASEFAGLRGVGATAARSERIRSIVNSSSDGVGV